METDFDYLRCPMCGGELIYSEGTHDLCCRRNRPEAGEEEKSEEGRGYAAGGGFEASALRGGRGGDGTRHEEVIDGLLATCLQHEMDHLEGILFIDRISRLKRQMAIKKLEKARKAA